MREIQMLLLAIGSNNLEYRTNIRNELQREDLSNVVFVAKKSN